MRTEDAYVSPGLLEREIAMTILEETYNFANLSLKDLLEARDLYHFHLLSKADVVGTAVGLYLIRKDEEWPQKKGEGAKPPRKKTYPRTLFNSEVRDYSWPCVLAFVRQWHADEEFAPGGRYKPSQILPRTLYMPDGRAVPVCVVEAKQTPPDGISARSQQMSPVHKFGGGFPIEVEVQGETHVATAGCLVTDGHLTYVLTARHACGESGTIVSSRLRSGKVPIGVSSDRQITRLPFSEVYAEFPGRRSYVSLDIGLVRLDNVGDWTSNTYGLPALGGMADVHEANLSTRFIDQPVLGVGAVSGLLSGKIKALFYRHRTVGGYDYVGDFLIGPDDDDGTHPGDLGMIWHLDVTDDSDKKKPTAERDLRPLAVEWGGQVFADSNQKSTFAVATSLSNACRILNVELVTDQSRGVSGYWGRTGHYSIATLAIELVRDTRLKGFLQKHSHILSFGLDAIQQKNFDKEVGKLGPENAFVPLADVPDEIWKKLPFGNQARKGGRDIHPGPHGSDGPEHPNHYADVDFPVGPPEKTWRARCLADDSLLTTQKWIEFYQDMIEELQNQNLEEEAHRLKNPFKQGLLPFRVWQFFVAMVKFTHQKDTASYLTAAGLVAHYIGDACQPLHGSVYSDGDPTREIQRLHPRTGETETVRYGKDVHSAYETAMLAAHAHELIDLINAELSNLEDHVLPLAPTGKAMAKAILKLMDDVAGILPPMEILDAFEQNGAGKGKATLQPMWDALGERTAEVMALGARNLAMMWDATWLAGGGDDVPNTKLKPIDEDTIRSKYTDPEFVPSLTLSEIGPKLA